jgi:hypothetical protein
VAADLGPFSRADRPTSYELRPSMRLTTIVRRTLLLVLLAWTASVVFSAGAFAACPDSPTGPTPCPTARAPAVGTAPQPTASAPPESGNDTLKLASLGIVFLLIGAAVVYAPQIVSAITSVPRRRSRPQRPVAPKTRPAPAPPTPAPRPPGPAPSEITISLDEPSPRVPERERIVVNTESQPDDVVSRLQTEVRSAWSKNR